MPILNMTPDEMSQLSPESISDWFWEIIERSALDRGNLATILQRLTKDEVHRFQREFDVAVYLLMDDAIIEQMGRVSESEAIEICEWIVSHGREYYENMLRAPKNIPLWKNLDHEENLALVAYDVYSERFGESLLP